MDHTFGRRALAALVFAVAAGCEIDGNYEASVAVLADSTRASLTLAADGDMELWLQQFFESEAFGWEHCPVLHANATVNGAPMEVLNAGGWVPVSGGGPLFGGGGGGYCESMHYQLLDPPAALLEMEDVRIELRDEGGVITIEVPFIGTPTLRLAEPRALRPGQRAEIAILPSARAVDVSTRTVRYIGDFAEKAPGHTTTGFKVEELEATEVGMAFTVPDMPFDSHGVLSLLHERRSAGMPSAGWPLHVTRCEGVRGCEANKTLPGPIELEVSVSTKGEVVRPDPREDHAHWSSCWFTGATMGAADLAWTDVSGCSWRLSPEAVLQAQFHGTYDSFALWIADFVPEQGTRYSARVEVKQTSSTWRHEDCSVVIDRVWTDIPETYAVVVDGSGECKGPATAAQIADAPITIAPFAFRVPAIQL